MEPRGTAAVLFLVSGMTVFDTYSALNSSPWTAENFGADPEKVRSLREYVCHAAVYSTAYCAVAAVIDDSWWPVVGAVVNNGYLVWLYWRASKRGRMAGSAAWANQRPAAPGARRWA